MTRGRRCEGHEGFAQSSKNKHSVRTGATETRSKTHSSEILWHVMNCDGNMCMFDLGHHLLAVNLMIFGGMELPKQLQRKKEAGTISVLTMAVTRFLNTL